MSNVVGRPNKYNRSQQPTIKIRLDKEVREIFQQICKSRGITQQDVIERFVKQFIEENKEATGQ